MYGIPWISSFGRHGDDKLLCLAETYILYELDKHIGMTTVKHIFVISIFHQLSMLLLKFNGALCLFILILN